VRAEFTERSPLTKAALTFAHPVEVACLLHEGGYSDEVVAAGVLHDVLEDTDAERADLEANFGPAVAWLVSAVSDDASIEDHAEREPPPPGRARSQQG
jgi:(p)ppGpp synthase/HD superfamily hydrolase